MAKTIKIRRVPTKSTPSLKPKSIERLKELARRPVRTLSWYRQVGAILHHEVPVVEGKKPRGVIRTIAKECFGDAGFATTLYGCRQFARVVDKDEMRDDMKGLGWAAAHYLMSVEDKDLRASLAQKARENRLKGPQVRVLVQEHLGKRSGGGRPTKIPDLGSRSSLRAIERISKEWVRHCKKWTENAAKQPRPTDNEWKGLLTSAIGKVQGLAGPIHECARQLEALRSPTRSQALIRSEVARLSEEWVRICETWLKVVSSEKARRVGRARDRRERIAFLAVIDTAKSAIKTLGDVAKLQLSRTSKSPSARSNRPCRTSPERHLARRAAGRVSRLKFHLSKS